MDRIKNVTEIGAFIAFTIFFSKIFEHFAVPEMRKFINRSYWLTKVTTCSPTKVIYDKEPS